MRVRQAKSLCEKVEKEMNDICNDCLNVIDKHLIPSAATDGESKTFYYRMYEPTLFDDDADVVVCASLAHSTGGRLQEGRLSQVYG